MANIRRATLSLGALAHSASRNYQFATRSLRETVDLGTRARLMLSRVSSGLRGASAWGKRHPTTLNVIAATLLGGTGDVLAQRVEGEEKTDLKRTLCVCAWYAPAACLFWTPFMTLQERLLGGSGLKAVIGKVASYNLAVATVDISGFHIVSLTPRIGFDAAVQALCDGYTEAVAAGLGLWLPAMSLIYWAVPPHLRLATSYALDVCWSGIMSFLSNRRKLQLEEKAALASPLNSTTDAATPALLPIAIGLTSSAVLRRTVSGSADMVS